MSAKNKTSAPKTGRKKKPEALFILGMHRSGTSALTRCMNLLGYQLPKTLMGANKSNQKGHWESTRLARLNDRILDYFGMAWSSWLPLDISRVPAETKTQFVNEIITIIQGEYDDGQPIVIKDPRISRLLPLYITALEKAGYQPKFILASRHPLEVASSLKARNDMALTESQMLWLRYNLDAEIATRAKPRAFVDYGYLLSAPHDYLSRALKSAKLAPLYSLKEAGPAIDNFLDGSQRHNTHALEDIMLDDEHRDWIGSVYQAWLVMCANPASKAPLKTFDQTRSDFNITSPQLLRQLTARRAEQSESQRLWDKTHDKMTSDIALLRGHISELKSASQQKDSETATLSRDHHKTQKQLEKSFADIETLQQQLIEKKDIITEHQDVIAQKNKALKQHEDTIAQKNKALKQHEDTIAQKNKALKQHEDTIAQKNKALKQHEDTIAQKNNALKQHEDTIAQKNDAIAKKELEKKDIQAKLKETGTQLSGIKKTLTKTADEAKTLRSEKRQLNREKWALQDRARFASDMVSALHQSTSWKATKPLRFVKRLFRPQPTPPQSHISIPPSTTNLPASHSAVPNEGIAKPATPAVKPAKPPKAASASLMAKVEASGLFDPVFYVSTYPDVQSQELEPLAHYLNIGWKKGYQPSERFNSQAYLASHPELKPRGENPLLHYIAHAAAAKISPSERKAVGRVAVFMAVAGPYDAIKEPELVSENADYFIFTDQDIPPRSVWQKREFEYFDADPTRMARFIKTHPHLYFSDYDWALWVDANLQINVKPEDIIAPINGQAIVSTWVHPLRNCVFDEASECEKRSKDDGNVMKAQIGRYKDAGYPAQNGLFETSVMASQMSAAAIPALMNDWWAEIEKGSRRDQLSFPFAARKNDITVAAIAPKGICMRSDPRFNYYRHQK